MMLHAEYYHRVTGNALREDQDEFLEAGVDIVLTKPILERNLRDALQAAKDRLEEIKSSPPLVYASTPITPVNQDSPGPESNPDLPDDERI